MLALYNTLLHAGLVLGLLLWPVGLISQRRSYQGLRERLTSYPPKLVAAMAGSRPIWIHAASVGEVSSVEPLIQRLRVEFPNRKFMVSTITASGHQLAQDIRPEVDGVTYLPLDLPWLVSRNLRRFQPALVILLETEIWPNFIRTARRLGIPIIILSGRLSSRSARRYQLFHHLFRPILNAVSGFGMQDRENADRIIRLGVEPGKVFVTGNLKSVGRKLEAFPGPFGPGRHDGPVIVAGSTHRGEEEIFLGILPKLRRLHPGLLMILAPRHPERFREVERLLRKRGERYGKRSDQCEVSRGDEDVLLLDTLGELPRFYECAHVTFVGGSLVPAGGHNIMEPARMGKPVLFGPHYFNIAETAREMLVQGGGVVVHNQGDVLREITGLLTEPMRAAAMGQRARHVVDGSGDVVSRSMRLVQRQLPYERTHGGS